ncbi:MAG: DNA recombination protein RmuC [Patescibacteria group bacterium]
MSLIPVVVIVVAMLLGFIVLYAALKPKEKAPDQSMSMLQNQIHEIGRVLDTRLSESNRVMQSQSGASAKLFGDVNAKLAVVEETSRQTLAMNEQIKKLQDTLTNPKQRGILGEYFLETVLKNVLSPGDFQMQYAFKDGVIVDAAVFVDKLVIPIDSKFSLENYNRFAAATEPLERKKYEQAFRDDLKNRIDETSKYVKPQEGTMDFAFMFIPSEAIYYDLLINKVGSLAENKDLIIYAFQKRVIIVSPTSFLAYLQTVKQGLRNQKISEQAKDIIKQVDSLRKHLITYEDYFGKIGKNLDTTVNMYNHANKEFGKIDKDFLKITDKGMDVDIKVIEGPAIEEGDGLF